MKFKDRIFASFYTGMIGNIVRFSIAFMLTPYLMHSLGEEGYGLWLLILATLGWFRFIDFGFSSAVQRSIAIALEARDNHKINVVFSCSILLFGILGIIAALLLVTISFFPEVLGVESEYFEVVHISLMILSIKLIWDLGMSSFNGFYSGMIRFDVDTNINTANEIIKALLIFVLIKKMNIYGAVLATMAADFITNILKIYYAKKLHPEFSFHYKLITMEEIKELFSYSKHVLAMSVAASLGSGVDSLIISHLLGLKFIAIYGIASRLVTMIERSFLPLLGIFQPIFTRLIERNGEIKDELAQVVSLGLFIEAIFFVPLMIFANDFIYLWIGDGFESAYPIVVIISFALISRTISRPIAQLLLAKAQHKYLSIVKVISVITNIILSIFLGRHFGLIGIAVATVFAYYLSDLVLHLFLCKRQVRYPISDFVFVFIKTNIIMLMMVGAGYYILKDMNWLTWLELGAYSGFTFIVCIAVFWKISLNDMAREKIEEVVRSKFKLAQ